MEKGSKWIHRNYANAGFSSTEINENAFWDLDESFPLRGRRWLIFDIVQMVERSDEILCKLRSRVKRDKKQPTNEIIHSCLPGDLSTSIESRFFCRSFDETSAICQ